MIVYRAWTFVAGKIKKYLEESLPNNIAVSIDTDSMAKESKSKTEIYLQLLSVHDSQTRNNVFCPMMEVEITVKIGKIEDRDLKMGDLTTEIISLLRNQTFAIGGETDCARDIESYAYIGDDIKESGYKINKINWRQIFDLSEAPEEYYDYRPVQQEVRGEFEVGFDC